MPDELIDILTDFMPNRDEAEAAAESIKDQRGQEILPDLIWNLTTHHCAPEQTEKLWQGIVDHNQEMSNALGRNPGLRVAAIDYFTNILGKNAQPGSVHPELLEHLFQQATNDALTGLANRRYFKARLKDEITRTRRYATSFAQLLFDVDDFKAVNDNQGHAEGDRILVGIADAIRACIRESDVGARWGGEEFSVLMPETTKEGGAQVAERIRTRIKREMAESGATISGGLAAFPGDAEDEEALFRFADRALYRAKSEGKNRICLSPDERRAHPRLTRKYPVSLSPMGAEAWTVEAETVNVSQGGLGFLHDRLLWVADEVRGVVKVHSHPASFRGRIAHIGQMRQGQYDVGVAFTEIEESAQEALLEDP